MECINLQEQFGTRYRIAFDAAYSPKHVPRDRLDLWTMQMPCERAVVYPHGGGGCPSLWPEGESKPSLTHARTRGGTTGSLPDSSPADS
jgi:hypothetical protein